MVRPHLSEFLRLLSQANVAVEIDFFSVVFCKINNKQPRMNESIGLPLSPQISLRFVLNSFNFCKYYVFYQQFFPSLALQELLFTCKVDLTVKETSAWC